MTAAPPVVYALALVPALLWGFSPVLSKRGMSEGGASLQAALVVVIVDSSLYWAALAALALFVPGERFVGLTPGALALFAFAGAVGTALGRIAVFRGVDRVGASVNSAAISARPLFATALAVGVLGEVPSLTTAAGVVVLVAGLFVLATARGGDVSGWDATDLLYPLGAALFFAVGNVVRRFGLRRTPVTALEAVAVNETAALVVLGSYALVRGRTDVLTAPHSTYAYFAGSGTLTAVALLSLFAALGHPQGRVAIVDPLTATAPLFTAVFAHFLLDDVEEVTRGIVTGAALVVAGAALIALG